MTPRNWVDDEAELRVRLRQRLEQIGWTQDRLAEAIGDDLKNVNRWLTGTKIPAAFLASYVRKVPVNPVWLLTGDGLPDPLPPDEASARLAEIQRIITRPVEDEGVAEMDAADALMEEDRGDGTQRGAS